jgi:CheY-like chemotaxis protein
MIRILLIGEDPAILSHRAGMLERPGVEVTCCLTAQFEEACVAQPPFDLVILCYTIEHDVKAAMLTAEIFRHLRQTPVLRIVKGTGEMTDDFGVDANLVMGDPGDIVEIALNVLGKSPDQRPSVREAQELRSATRAA